MGFSARQASLRYKNFFAEANGQFTLRGDGAHDYHFANDLTWNAGPGYYLVRKRILSSDANARSSGESKDVDRFQGRAAEDTGVTSVFHWAAHCRFARSNQRRVRRRISGLDEHDGVTGRCRIIGCTQVSPLAGEDLENAVARLSRAGCPFAGREMLGRMADVKAQQFPSRCDRARDGRRAGFIRGFPQLVSELTDGTAGIDTKLSATDHALTSLTRESSITFLAIAR